MKGVEHSVMKTLGQWESVAYLQYVHLPMDQLCDYIFQSSWGRVAFHIHFMCIIFRCCALGWENGPLGFLGSTWEDTLSLLH